MKKDIYVITNLITGAQYIGQSKDAVKRFCAHKAAKDNTLLHQAIRYYGSDNFIMKILENQIEDFNEKEKFWIKEKNTLYPNGYNMTKGGEGYQGIGGELCYQAKLTEDEVIEVANLLNSSTLSQEQIAKYFNVTQEIISNINCGKTYFHSSWIYPLRNVKKSEITIAKIKDELEKREMSLVEIAKKFDVSKNFIVNINQGYIYREERNYPIRQAAKTKLEEKEVIEIKELLEKEQYTFDEIGELYNTTRETIGKINLGKSYFHDNWEYPIRKIALYRKALSQEQIREIEYLLMNTNLSFRQIAKKIGLKSHGTISSINYGASKSYYNPKLKYPLRKPN